MYDDFKITKREVVFSIVIIAVMLVVGFIIHGNINDSLMLKYQEYNTALQIDNNANMFAYGMSTNIGNAFVYGELKSVDTVTFEEIGGEYSYVKKVKERYTRHTRLVTKTYTDADGNTHTYTEEEVYWTWDEVDRWTKHSEKIIFVGVEFDYGTIEFPSSDYITTQKESSTIRYKYYGSPAECSGTLYAELKDNTINKTKFYTNFTIDETISHLETEWQLVVFWIVWIIFIGCCVIGFCYLDNKWLEDKKKY